MYHIEEKGLLVDLIKFALLSLGVFDHLIIGYCLYKYLAIGA